MNDSTGMLDLIEAAWGIIANVSESDWSKQTPEWQAAAVRWRDRYHALLDTYANDKEGKEGPTA